MIIIEIILKILLLLVISIVIHELGHWLWYWRNKQQPFNLSFFYDSIFSFGFKSIWKVKVTPEEEINSLLFGIGSGMFFITIIILISQAHYYIYALPIYTAGCRSDIHRLIDIIKEQNIDFKLRIEEDR